TGEFLVTEVDSLRKLSDEIFKYSPSEIICNEAFMMSGINTDDLKGRLGILIEPMDARYFSDASCRQTLLDHFHIGSLDGLGVGAFGCGVNAAGALLSYLFETQKNDLSHLSSLKPYHTEEFMLMDASSARNLELIETLREKEKRGSLFWVLDRTRTAMGARLLRKWIEQPLIDRKMIEERLDAVEALNNNEITCSEIREYLNPVYDLERLAARISYKSANPRDLIALKHSLEMLPHIKALMGELAAERMNSFYETFDPLEDICSLIEAAIAEDPPLAMKEGGIIRDGYNAQADGYRAARKEGKSWLAELEASEREKTGIHTLKVKFNRVFGYCIEVSNSFKNKVPDSYTRKQTLVGGERYTMPRLKELEDKILGAEDKLNSLEYELFCEVRDEIGKNLVRIQKSAGIIAELDVLASFSEAARRYRYVRPKINEDGRIDIKGGRHPVVERMIENDAFVPNDTYLDMKKKRVSIITGPNMAGKSTYMRQSALIVLMAQIGSFVPAKSADIGLVDRIFTRVGASDDLASGQSTFMVEMTEVANILRNATPRSLLILDEIGRGTSTFDGLSIAWAVIEYIADRKIIGAKTLFATHYHELTELEGKLDGVNNYCIAVREKEDGIVFLRKIIKGGADKSYGVQVARLAGVPEAVLTRAGQLAEQLSASDITAAVESIAGIGPKTKSKTAHYDEVDLSQMSLFDTVRDEDILTELKDMDISNMTPVDALNELYRLQNKLKNRWKNT
nr:DNA mismatch repair protein MutS [Lachnospiraceae bacterium]